MKTNVICRNPKAPAFPNAADRSYFLKKLLDGALAVAIAVGTVTALIFLFLL